MPRTVNANFTLIEIKNNIVFIEDISHLTGGMTITNNAEAVYHHLRSYYGAVRVVYKCTDGTWWEICRVADEPGEWRVAFAEWNGLVWDQLKTVD